MDTMHLFAGIGGGLLADLILGHRPVVAVEWDKYACQVLRERAAEGWFPDLRVWEGDVRLFDPSEYAGRVDCIHAGFPCTDLSVAGNQAGIGEGTRSGLYREVIRIAGIVRPKYIFFENVTAILSGGLESVLSDLAQMGFDAEWCCLSASSVGAWHQRDRWWLMATDNRCRRGSRDKQKEIQGKQSVPWSKNVRSVEDFRKMFPHIEPLVRGNGYGVPHVVHRLKGLGNAQVPLQAAAAWKLLGGP